jgi:hypothetical protein
VDRIRRIQPNRLDDTMQELHEAAFETIDCLSCANCCKTTSPIFLPKDIDRIAKGMRMRPAAFIEKYLRVDSDGDYVLQQAPCPFLLNDNACMIYEDRPTACRTYPHTDRKKSIQLLELGLKNTLICPAVQQIFDRLEAQFPAVR